MMGEAEWPDDVPEEDRRARPNNWSYFVQPPAVVEIRGPDNKGGRLSGESSGRKQKWLKPGYYEEKLAGKSKRWIDSRLQCHHVHHRWRSGLADVQSGLSLAGDELRFISGHKVVVGLDFGRRPTAVMMQCINDRIYIQREFRQYNASAATFAPALKRYLEQHYPSRWSFGAIRKDRTKGQATDDALRHLQGERDDCPVRAGQEQQPANAA